MSLYLDTSVLVAALIEDEPHHEACLNLLADGATVTWSHSLAEAFATLTGGRLGIRVDPATAFELLRDGIAARVDFVELPADQMLAALEQTRSAGVRGGAVYDYLQLHAARRAQASRLVTLNVRHFRALATADDPAIALP